VPSENHAKKKVAYNRMHTLINTPESFVIEAAFLGQHPLFSGTTRKNIDLSRFLAIILCLL